MLIRTERLDLVAATLTHIQAELESATALGRLLEAEVPSSWPPGEYDEPAQRYFLDCLVKFIFSGIPGLYHGHELLYSGIHKSLFWLKVLGN